MTSISKLNDWPLKDKRRAVEVKDLKVTTDEAEAQFADCLAKIAAIWERGEETVKTHRETMKPWVEDIIASKFSVNDGVPTMKTGEAAEEILDLFERYRPLGFGEVAPSAVGPDAS